MKKATCRQLIFPIFFLLISISCSRESAELLYKIGENLWNKGEVESSLDNFLKIIEKYPDSDYYDDALFRTGELYYLNYRNFLNAIKYFRQLLLDNNSSFKLKFQAQTYIAEILYDSLKNYDLAIIEYQRLINNFGNRVAPDLMHFKIARCYYKKGDYRQAIVEYEILLEQFPASHLAEESIYQIITSNFVLGDCSKAFKRYNMFRERYPESQFMPDVKFEIGSCYEEEGDLIKSLEIFNNLEDVYANKKLLKMKINSIEKRLSLRKR